MSITRPSITIKGVNPYYLLDAALNLFDQSELSERGRFFPLLKFQETGLILAALYRFVQITAPSQSGKTTLAEILAAVFALAFPGSNTLILSTNETQSERLLRDTNDKLIKCCTVPELRLLDIDNTTTLRIAENGSTIKAFPHSLKALTGNPADFIIIDEEAKFDKEPSKIMAEAIARTGQTGGRILEISTFFGEGTPDPKSQDGFRGNFYHYRWSKTFNNRSKPNSDSIAARFTYHVSPFLVNNIDVLRREMNHLGKGYFEEHYLCIPRKAVGRAVFEHDFSRTEHVHSDANIPLNPNEPLFLCFDPGLSKAAVLGQLDPETVRLIYLRDFLVDRDIIFEDFVKSVVMRCRREFPEFYIQYFADVASRRENDQTGVSNVEVISRLTGQVPVTQYQNIEPGIQAMRSFMRRRGGFYVSDKCKLLPDAFESGLVYQERNGVPLEKWVKDGHWEHVGDASRYPVHYLTGGFTADALESTGAYDVQANPNANSITGY